MGIKEITLPKEVMNLPQPWGQTSLSLRHKQLETLSYQQKGIKRALNVLERCLDTLSLLPSPSEDSIPKFLTEYWTFTAHGLAEEMPTLDELRLYKIEEKLKEYGVESPTPTLILEFATYWLWSVVFDIADSALYCIQRALMRNREQILISRFLLIASRYWQKIDPDLADSLLSRSAMIGRQKALPLLERVEQNPLASEAIKETARGYRQYVLKRPDKWLPEEQPSHQSDQSDQSDHLRQLITQPALTQLAYVSP